MKEILKFGTPGRECPHCVGPQAFKSSKFTREEIRAQEKLVGEVVHAKTKTIAKDGTEAETVESMLRLHHEAEKTRDNVRAYAVNKLKGKVHDKEIREALAHQARIAQLDHHGWDIEIHAWVNVCPDCDRVTEYRAAPAHKMLFGIHGPVAESNSCTDCIKAKEKAAIEAETLRLSKMTNEQIEAERAALALAETVITQEYIDAEIKKAEVGGGIAPKDSARILRLMNNVGRRLGDLK